MSRIISRRRILKSATNLLAGVAGITGCEQIVATRNQVQSQAQTKTRNTNVKAYGVVLTNAYLSELRDCISRGNYNTIKVVTAWGLKEGWNEDTRRQVCEMTPNTIVLTAVGNGVEKDAFPYTNIVLEQIKPWYEVNPEIFIEIGNEPNGNVWGRNRRSSEFVKEWRSYFQQAVKACRQEFPKAKLISSGLASLGIHKPDLYRWCDIAGDVMSECDYIGFHFYVKNDWYDQDTGFPDIISTMKKYFSHKAWMLTEFGIENRKVIPYVKGIRYADLINFGKSNPVLPKNVWGATYFHLDMNRTSDLHHNFNIYPSGDDAYRRRTSSDYF